MIFEFDRWVDGRPYPNLARWQARPYTPEWRQFSLHWPFSEPPMLIQYMDDESVALPNADDLPRYIVAVSYFDFSIDWPALLPKDRLQALKDKCLRLIFYYSEGDHPGRMHQHICSQFAAAGVSWEMIRIVSANSLAQDLKGCVWFADDELLFRKRNRFCDPIAMHDRPRSRLFTALVRTHKWWRATVMADFWRRGWHDLGWFSYNPEIIAGDSEQDNPIEIDRFPGLRQAVQEFITQKFEADDLTSDQHNDHHLLVPQHFADSYLNVVIETHMDVDQSAGVFVTEKTFKPIKNCQPFVIFGAAHTLARLRDLGYRTFDNVIDNSYDTIENTTERYERIMQILQELLSQGHDNMHAIYQQCGQDLVHNQRHFLAPKRDRLNKLLENI